MWNVQRVQDPDQITDLEPFWILPTLSEGCTAADGGVLHQFVLAFDVVNIHVLVKRPPDDVPSVHVFLLPSSL